MSNINKQALREAAEKAISEEGETWWNEEQLASDYGLALHRADAKFIAATNPATVLALLDELEAANKAAESGIEWMKRCLAAEKRIAELEAREVVLPGVQDVHPLGPQSAKIFCEFHRNIINRCADEILKVGVNVSIKGE